MRKQQSQGWEATLDVRRMGIAAMRPGLMHAIQLLQREYDGFTAYLNGDAPVEGNRVKRGPKNMAPYQTAAFSKKMSKNAKNVWARMTPAQRKARIASMVAGKAAAQRNGKAEQ